LTLEEMQIPVARAVAVLGDPAVDRAVRANAAYGFLSQVAGNKHDLPDGLRPQFDGLWAAFHRAEPRIAEVLAQRERFSLFSETEFEECVGRTRAFAASLEREIARQQREKGTPAPPRQEEEPESEENGGRAAAE
jgi:hypothetical protein